jgi:hypothetical protein
VPERPFPPEFRERLANGKYTRWAVDLPYDTLQALLWMVGEFGCRAGPDWPTIDRLFQLRQSVALNEVPPEYIRLPDNPRSKAALHIIAAIVGGRRMNLKKANELFLHMIKGRPGLLLDLQAWEKYGVVKVEWLAKDDAVCALCAERNGKVFTIQEARALVNAGGYCRRDIGCCCKLLPIGLPGSAHGSTTVDEEP